MPAARIGPAIAGGPDVVAVSDRSVERRVPGVDAALLVIHRRQTPILPTWLAPGFCDVLRAGWQPPAARARRSRRR